MLSDYFIIVILLSAIAFTSVKAGKLTAIAGTTGWITGLLLFAGAGYAGVVMLAVFFVLGTGATSWGISIKQKLGLAEKDKGKRTAGQVIANAGAAAMLGILSFFYPAKSGMFILMIAACFASATADTLSSELGNVYGKNFYNVITLKKDTRGLNGVISFEGTVVGTFGSCIIAAMHSLFFGFTTHFLLIIIAGTAGNFADSILGATLERKGYLNNNEVNFLNTTIASLIALFLAEIIFKK